VMNTNFQSVLSGSILDRPEVRRGIPLCDLLISCSFAMVGKNHSKRELPRFLTCPLFTIQLCSVAKFMGSQMNNRRARIKAFETHGPVSQNLYQFSSKMRTNFALVKTLSSWTRGLLSKRFFDALYSIEGRELWCAICI